MNEPDADLLKQQVLELVYAALRADSARNRADGMTTGMVRVSGLPERFSSRAGVEQARSRIIEACNRAQADESLQCFLSTRWLERFAPVAM